MKERLLNVLDKLLNILATLATIICIAGFFILRQVLIEADATRFVRIYFFSCILSGLYLLFYRGRRVEERMWVEEWKRLQEKDDELAQLRKEAGKQIAALREELEEWKQKSLKLQKTVLVMSESFPEKTEGKKAMDRRKERKRSLIEEIAFQHSHPKVLHTIYWFGWITRTQIADYLQVSPQRVSTILTELDKHRMVGHKKTGLQGLKYWYLLQKGREVLQVREPRLELPSPVKKGQIPDTPDRHRQSMIDIIIELTKKGFICASPQQVLWPKHLQNYGKQYQLRPDTWATANDWNCPFAVEIEKSFRGDKHFPEKLARLQKMFFEKSIPTLYIPASKEVENDIERVIKKLRETGEYTTTIKKWIPEHKRKWGNGDQEYETEKIGIGYYGFGFLFSDAKMNELILSHTPTGDWIKCPFRELANKVDEVSQKAKRGWPRNLSSRSLGPSPELNY